MKVRLSFLIFLVLNIFLLPVFAENLKENQIYQNFVSSFEMDWIKRQGDFAVEKEAISGMFIVTATKPGWLSFISKEKFNVPIEMRAFVRLRTIANKSAYAYFQIGKKDAADQGINLSLSTVDNPAYPEHVGCSVRNSGKLIHDNDESGKTMDWVPVFSNDFTYILKAYPKILPGWQEDYRRQIENDMSALPDHNSKWIEIRIVLREDSVWFWVDDRLVAYKKR